MADGNKSPGRQTLHNSKTPLIHVTYPNVPEVEIGELLEAPIETTALGEDNTAFQQELSDSASDTTNSKSYTNAVFVFDSDCTSLYSRRGSTADEAIHRFAATKESRRVSNGQSGRLTGNLSNLTVPSYNFRNNDSSSDNNGWRLRPLDSISQTHIPPQSPGYLSTNSACSELEKLQFPRQRLVSDGGYSNSDYSRGSIVSSSLSDHLRYLVRAFSSRTEKVKETTVQPMSPSSSSFADTLSDALSAISTEHPQVRHRLDSFIPREEDDDGVSEFVHTEEQYNTRPRRLKIRKCLKKLRFPHVLDPQGKLYMCWLFVVTIAFIYNAWVIPLRAVFPYQTRTNLKYWLLTDYLCDCVYIIDILFFKMRLSFLNSGLKETSRKATRANYFQKRIFIFDCLSLLPLDILYFIDMNVQPLYRLPRLLKIQTFWEFYSRCDHRARSSHTVRIVRTMTYMLFLIHVETCGYYAVSVYEGIGINEWVYNGEGFAYVRCLYLATKTATSIGNNPIPQNELEYMFMTVYWVSGVFVFALLIGQIRDIVDAANLVKTIYRQHMDGALEYVKNMNVPMETQDRVRTWFIYNWQQQQIIDERNLMDALPLKLRTDLAIHVHFNTLSKVKLFQDCDKTLLYDLVLKLKPILYLPTDYVCKKGEIGTEMYIVSQGIVEVVGGADNTLVLATLKEGSVFGEISLLAMAAEGNRRTADVRCKGFTNLFILSKGDFEEAMKDYPDAHKLLRKRARKLLRLNAKIQKQSTCSMGPIQAEPIIKPHRDTPEMVHTVIQMMDPKSMLAQRLGTRSNCSTIRVPSRSAWQTNQPCSDNEAFTQGSEITISKQPSIQEMESFYDDMIQVNDWSDVTVNTAQGAAEEATVNIAEPDTAVDVTTNQLDDEQKTAKKDSNASVGSSSSGIKSQSSSPVHQDSKGTNYSELVNIMDDSDDGDIHPTLDGGIYDLMENDRVHSQMQQEILDEMGRAIGIDGKPETEVKERDITRTDESVSPIHDNRPEQTSTGVRSASPSAASITSKKSTISPLQPIENMESSKNKKSIEYPSSRLETDNTVKDKPNTSIVLTDENGTNTCAEVGLQDESIEKSHEDFIITVDPPNKNYVSQIKAKFENLTPNKSQNISKQKVVKDAINSAKMRTAKIYSRQESRKPTASTKLKLSNHDNKGAKKGSPKVKRRMKSNKVKALSDGPVTNMTTSAVHHGETFAIEKGSRNDDKQPTSIDITTSSVIVSAPTPPTSIIVSEASDTDSVDNVADISIKPMLENSLSVLSDTIAATDGRSQDIPQENQVTCFAEVHREKSLSLSSRASSPRRRKISVISMAADLKESIV